MFRMEVEGMRNAPEKEENHDTSRYKKEKGVIKDLHIFGWSTEKKHKSEV